MKVLLINPPARDQHREEVVVPPLWLAYLAAIAEREGHRVQILDAFAQGMSWGEFEKEAKTEKPDLVGIGGMTPTIDSTLRAMRICRPYTKTIVMGGPHFSVFKGEFFKECPELDYGIAGEGEESFALLLKRIDEGKEPEDVPGLFSPKGVSNPAGELIRNLDEIPFPARHLLPKEAYRYPLWPGKKVTTLFSSRGCPYHCLFCDKSIFGSQWRPRSPGNVLDELEIILKKMEISKVIFYDDLFTLQKQRVVEICQGILERGLKFEWKCEGRVDRIDEEMLRWMKKAGCTLIAYGVESGNQIGLDYLQKGITLSQIRKAFQATRRAGIRPMAYFILGIPVETFAQGLRTIAFARGLKPDYAQFSVLSPFKGTPLYEEAIGKGWYREVNAQNPFDKDRKRPVLASQNWSEESLREILRIAHRRFYFRPDYILKRIKNVRSLREARSLCGVGRGLLQWYWSKGGPL
jgi:anaerobic magnesium-protoporphyrin IX monomethyl ester cyclase